MDEHTDQVSQTGTPSGVKLDKKTWIIIGVVAVAVLLLGNMYSPERMTERAVEQAFEAQGIDADIDVREDGSFEYAATGDDGENIQMSAGEHVQLPAEWPSNVPVPRDAALTYAGTVAGDEGATNYMVSYTTSQSIAEISAFYTDAFKANGWTAISNVAMPDSLMLSVTYDESGSVGVYAAKDPAGLAVTLNVNTGK